MPWARAARMAGGGSTAEQAVESTGQGARGAAARRPGAAHGRTVDRRGGRGRRACPGVLQAWQRRKWEVRDGAEGAGVRQQMPRAQTAVTANTGTRGLYGSGSSGRGHKQAAQGSVCLNGHEQKQKASGLGRVGAGEVPCGGSCQQEGLVGMDKEGAHGRHRADGPGHTGSGSVPGGRRRE